MSQLDDLQTYVNENLPLRPIQLRVSNTGYDGDPNDGPPIFTSSPAGYYYLEETPETLWRKTTGGAWIKSEAGGAATTLEDLTIPIDYNAGTAVDAPATEVFTTQAEVDAYLASEGATAFKHFQRLWANLPPIITHAVDLDFAIGVHRPDPTDTAQFAAFQATGKVYGPNGIVRINGVTSASWTVLSGPLTVLSHVVDSDDPRITFSGTPFTAGALRGRFAIIGGGQVAVIHKNTADTLYVCTALSPAPTDGVTQVSVSKPSTIIRNSLTDFAGSAHNGECVRFEDNVTLTDLTIEGWAPFYGTDLRYQGQYSDSFSANTNLLIDNGAYFDILGVTGIQQYSVYIAPNAGKSVTFRNWIIRVADKANDATNFALTVLDGSLITWGGYGGYIKGSRFGIICGKAGLGLQNTVIDELGWTSNPNNFGVIQLIDETTMGMTHFSGKVPEIRNCIKDASNPDQAVVFLDNHPANRLGGPFTKLAFADNEPHCIRVNEGKVITGQFTDRGGNLRTGILVFGPRATVLLSAADTVSGALGDIEIEGVVGPYGDLPPTATPLVTGKLNLIGRD